MNEKPTTIFLADDNPENLKVLSDILESEGYRTRASLSGITMLESIRIEIPDLIILDIHMPEKDGYEICTELKRDKQVSSVPVIFCSALNETFNIVQAFEVGGVDYITKPFRTREVLARSHTHIELRRRQQSLETALTQLKTAQHQMIQTEKMTSLGTLLAGVAHEINNPVNYIINSLEAYRTDFADLQRLLEACDTPDPENINRIKQDIGYQQLLPEMQELLDGIESGAGKIHRMVQSIRSFSASPDDSADTVDPCEEINRSLLMIRPQIGSKVKLHSELPQLPMLHAQPGRLSQAVLHLLQNAVQAVNDIAEKTDDEKDGSSSSSGGSITVSAEKTDATVHIRVADSGIGIPEDILDQVLDPFFSTRTTGYGTGLGLPTAQHIIADLGGSLRIDSTEGTGTTVRIELPIG